MADPKSDQRQSDHVFFFVRVTLRGKELLDSLCVSVDMPVGRGGVYVCVCGRGQV